MWNSLYFRKVQKQLVWFVLIILICAIFMPTNISSTSTPKILANPLNQSPKNMTLYLQNSSSARYVFDYSTTYIFNTTLGNKTTAIWDQQRVRMNWYLHPLLAGDFDVTGNISFVVYINTKGVSANANLYVDIYDVTYKSAGTETSTKVYSGSDGITVTSGIDSYQVDISNSQHTFKSGSSIRIYCEIQGGASAEFGLWYGNNTYDSRIIFEAYDSLNIEKIKTKDYLDYEQSNFQLNAANKTIKMQANVSDIFGGYDINLVKLTLTDPADIIILNNVSMYKIGGTPISLNNEFEAQWNYSSAIMGSYQITVWVVDNNGYYHYYHKEKFNFGDYPDIKTSTFYIGGQPRFGLVTVKDKGPQPKVLEGAVVKVMKGNNEVFMNITNPTGHAGVYAFQGVYDIIVEWEEVVVGLVDDFLVDENFNLTIDVNVFYPSFMVVDNSGNPLEGANVYIHHPNGTFLVRPYSTDPSGLFNIDKAPIGEFGLIVKWRDVEVADVTHLVDKNGLIATIFTQVYIVNLRFVDSRNIDLPGAQVTFADALSSLILDSKLSNLQGRITSQLPAGTYNVTVRWQQRVIQQFELKLTGDIIQTISCWVYYVNFIILDPEPHNIPVENAQIVFTAPESGGLFDSQLTGPDGKIETRLPIGLVDIKVYWKSTLVNTTQFMISGGVSSQDPIKLRCAIYYLTLHAVDSKDKAVENAQITVTFFSNKEVVDTILTNTTGHAVFRLPMENYDILIRWRDADVYIESNKSLNFDEYYKIKCKIYYLTLKAVDSKNKAVENAQITISFFRNKEVVDTFITTQTGQVVFRLPEESYDISVRWQNTVVYLETNKAVTKDEYYELNCNIFYLTLKAVDSQNITVENAQITISYSSNKEVLDTIITNQTGQVIFRLPKENYDILVRWHDADVYFENNKALTTDEYYELHCNIYYLTLKALDSRNIPVENAQIMISFSDNNEVVDTLITTETGQVIFRLPKENYNILVRWQDTDVYFEQDREVTKNEYYEMNCNIYYLTMKAIDSRDIPVENAQITITFSSSNVVIDTLITNTTGYAVSRLPKEEYNIKVRWYDTEIYQENNRLISKDEEYNLECWVYYLKISALDSKNIPLVDAQVAITRDDQKKITATGITDDTGSLESRLPIGAYNIEVTWESVLVKSELGYNVTKDDSISLMCNVFYFVINIVDYEKVPLENAKVTIKFNSNAKVYDSAVTGYTGAMESRIPIGNYDLEIIWKNVIVYSESAHSIISDKQYTVTAKVFYLRIKTVSNEKIAIKDVSVTIKDFGRELLENNYTLKNGRVEFRLPYDNYDIKARLQTTHLYADIDQSVNKKVELTNESIEVTLKFDGYPPPFTDTPVFGIVSSIIIFIIILILLWFFILRKRLTLKKNKHPEEEIDERIATTSTLQRAKIRPELVKKPTESSKEKVSELKLNMNENNDNTLIKDENKTESLKVNKDTLSELLSSSKKD